VKLRKRTSSRYAVGAALPLALVAGIASASPAYAETTYTLTQVAAHSTASDCWSVVSGSVYDLTAFIPRHEGGAARIIAMCGIDGTASYLGQHQSKDAEEANRALARYRIGAFDSTPPPVPAATYTLAQVAAHSTPSDCWSVVSGGVYDLTAWIGRHPGGSSTITAMCGTDGTASFTAQHGSSASAKTSLAQFRVGTVDSTPATTAPTTAPPTAPATPSTSTATKTYVLRQVRRHRTARNCWSVVNGNVYNLSSWTRKHRAQRAWIRSMCGRNATTAYNAMVDGPENASRILARYQIGTLRRAGQATAPASVPAPAPGGAPSSAPAASQTYTAAQVAEHKTAGDCWSIVNGRVFDLTAWVGKHPGGRSVIVAMCGVDGTAAYNGKHGGSASANASLASYQIGTLG